MVLRKVWVVEVNFGVRAILLCMVLPLAGAAVAVAQSFEVPNVEYANDKCELRAENRVFVQAPLETHQKIVKVLREHSDLQIVERPEEADFMLLFTYTPFADGSPGDSPLEVSGAMTARAELAAVKFVNHSEGQLRPRILFYWTARKSFRSLPIPMQGLSPNGFAMPRSGKSAAAELIGRLALWAVNKKWRGVYFDQFTNQLTISTGGKFEVNGAKAFLKELKDARSDAYARRCAPPPVRPAEYTLIVRPTHRVVGPDLPTTVALPPAKRLRVYQPARNSRPLSGRRPRTDKRPGKAHRVERPGKRGRRR